MGKVKKIKILPDLPKLKGKIFYRDKPNQTDTNTTLPNEYARHAYQYATSSHPKNDMLPAAIVYVACDKDIKLVIDYARKNGIAVSVRSGGHSYAGSSSTSGDNIQIDLGGAEYKGDEPYPYVGIEFLETLTGKGHKKQEKALVRIGAGTPIYKVAEELHKRGLFFAHGQCAHLCIGGHSQSGGFSPLSRSVGMMIDYIQSYEIFTADGKKRVIRRDTTNKDDADLFYSLAGGSPGNFGIITHVTVEPAHDSDYTVHGLKIVIQYDKTRLKQMFDFTCIPRSPDYACVVTVLSAEDKDIENKGIDEVMRVNFPDFYHGSRPDFYPKKAIAYVCAVIRKGKDLPITDEMKKFFKDAHASYTVFGRIDNYGIIDPDKIPQSIQNAVEKWRGFEPSIKQEDAGASKVIGNVSSVDFEDQVRLLNGNRGKQTMSWWNYQIMFLNFYGGQREFALPFVKGKWFADPNVDLTKGDFKEFAVDHIDNIINERKLKMFCQFAVLGSDSPHNPDKKTCSSFRDSTAIFGSDVFYEAPEYDEKNDSRIKAEEYVQKARLALVGSDRMYAKKERYHVWFPAYDRYNIDKYWWAYYDSKEVYDRVLKTKKKFDPSGVFTPNSFCVGSSLV